MLTNENIDFIRNEIQKSSISIPELKDDLLDHFCCFVENELKKGKTFENAYSKATIEICPNGFGEIQEETIYMLNYNRIIIMKKIMYGIGFLTSVSISVGGLFKLMDWPGGGNLFTYGFLGFVLIFIPMLAIDRYKLHVHKALSEKLRLILGFCSALIIGLAVLFKMMHLQGASILLVLGACLFAFGFLPFLFFKMYRKSVE